MKITKLKIINFRTFENIDIDFDDFYSAICGQNDAGKSNIVRALRAVLREDNIYGRVRRRGISAIRDYPRWKETKIGEKEVRVTVDLTIYRKADAGVFEFFVDYLDLEISDEKEMLCLRLRSTWNDYISSNEVIAEIEGQTFEGIKAQEIHNKVQLSILIHNSTEIETRGSFTGFLQEFSEQYSTELSKMTSSMKKSLTRIAKTQKEEVSSLLSRLNSNLKVGITVPNMSFDRLPYNLSLGDSKMEVDLDDWGSGTKNRTMIFLTLLKAKQVSESVTTAETLTPILIIEEPESFLHPSAQAEFGRILQQISNEFGVQVITTTHSPYMLNQSSPESNILLQRKVVRKHLRETIRVDTSGDNWMEPFGVVLGLANNEFKPWREIFFSESKSHLLVEGKVDKEYFELLRLDIHGKNKLSFEGDIFPYDGCGNLKNPTLLNFLKSKSKDLVVAFDIDVVKDVEPTLQRHGFEKNKSYVVVGINKAGSRSIEGLIPEEYKNRVNTDNPDLVQEGIHGTREEQKIAKNKLKSLYLDEFKQKAEANSDDYAEFYKLVKILNKAFK
ncbi:ATP-dependent nuclease [Leptothoe sp. PORK10 BA2]|uniref:ATP-dependent nuclease n=1 Tax=Leptothoe sp. PORK10 BA2 TaxID=3110254 RepID=UPI002B220F8A|nr:AAA family ATPase [Leptothoe sp. PORK10 BA2]MEA5464218.1 AAA family ATPase [Leptothoe sp. PORK10 BA2]